MSRPKKEAAPPDEWTKAFNTVGITPVPKTAWVCANPLMFKCKGRIEPAWMLIDRGAPLCPVCGGKMWRHSWLDYKHGKKLKENPKFNEPDEPTVVAKPNPEPKISGGAITDIAATDTLTKIAAPAQRWAPSKYAK